MLRNVGFTNNTENFFFRDVGEERDPQNVSYGLFADGFRTRYDDCARGGGTLDAQGEIFVR